MFISGHFHQGSAIWPSILPVRNVFSTTSARLMVRVWCCCLCLCQNHSLKFLHSSLVHHRVERQPQQRNIWWLCFRSCMSRDPTTLQINIFLRCLFEGHSTASKNTIFIFHLMDSKAWPVYSGSSVVYDTEHKQLLRQKFMVSTNKCEYFSAKGINGLNGTYLPVLTYVHCLCSAS